MSRTVLVTGATGQQGGAVARALLAQGWQVRALVRNPEATPARALQELGARLVPGDLNVPGTLPHALEGVDGVFSVQTFLPQGVEAETRQGIALADAAAAAGVGHLVYSSVGGAERHTGIPHFESKARVERHLGSLALPTTILRPALFMENFGTFMAPRPVDGGWLLAMALPADRPLQLVWTADIAAFAALAFADPGAWTGRAVELAGPQLAETFARVWGVPVSYEALPLAPLLAQSPELGAMFRWFAEEGYAADLHALRALHPGLRNFEEWLRAALPRPSTPRP